MYIVNNDWKDFEQLVKLIEMSIDPYSSVEHDVKMPILSSPSQATTQCDLVIRTGKPPRETITIVEVQNRRSKVKPNDFRGWKQKLQEVGAQHLICVSRQPFPESIKEQAQLSGDTIRLITLSTLDADKIPIDLFQIHFEYRKFELTKLYTLNPGAILSDVPVEAREWFTSHKKLNHNDCIFSLDRINLVSISELCRDLYVTPEGMSSGRGKLVFERDQEPAIFIHYQDISFEIILEIEFDWKADVVQIPASTLSYEQNDSGALAWVVGVSYNSPKGYIDLKIPASKFEGGYLVSGIMAELPPDISLKMELVPRDGGDEQLFNGTFS